MASHLEAVVAAAVAAEVRDKKVKNTLPLYGNKETMNLNSMILTNVMGSPYFKEDLVLLKTFHEVVDEIYYKVHHVEPWEKNSRKLAGQVGMCGGVRGVAAGGIVSTSYCLLYKLFTLKLTRRQLTTMINHTDSPYIRALGFMYIRYCQPPHDFWDWFGTYITDEEEIDLKAGGGYKVTIGEMIRMMLTKLDWFGTLFPRIPVNVQKDLEEKIKEAKQAARIEAGLGNGSEEDFIEDEWTEENRGKRRGERERPGGRSRERSRSNERRRSRSNERRRSRSNERRRSRSRSPRQRRRRDDSRERRRARSRSRDRRERSRSRERRERRDRSRSRERREKRRSYSRDRERRRSRSRERERRDDKGGRSREKGRKSRDGSRERRSRERSRERRRDRSRSRDRR